MTDMQEKGNSGVLRKKILVYGAVFLCAIFVVWGACMGASSIKSFGAQLISITEKSFGTQEKERGVFSLHEKTDSVEEADVLTPSHCIFETLGVPKGEAIIINEVAWMGGISGTDAEWIELKNISENEVNLRGWEIVDKDEQIKIKIGDVTILPNSFFLAVRNSKDQKLKGDISYDGALRNTNEGVRLFNAECSLEDEIIITTWPAGDNKIKKTMERNGGGVGWHTSLLPGGTPGGENSNIKSSVLTGKQVNSKQIQNTGLPRAGENKITEKIKDNTIVITGATTTENNSAFLPVIVSSSTKKTEVPTQTGNTVLISEVCAGTEENAKYEFIELYNNSNSPVDLTGWTIKKKSSTGNETTLVSASRLKEKTIFPQTYFLIGNEGGYTGSPTPHATWPGSYTLAYSKNSVVVYKGSEKIDEASWEEIPKGKSITRISWASSNFSISNPSPGR